MTKTMIMTKSDTILQWFLAAAAMLLVLTSCNKDLKDDVDDLKNRVTTIEQSVDLLQQAISSGKLISSVDPVAPTSTTPGGWLITFSDKSTISINNGANGTNGSQGEQGIPGIPGAPGQTPYIWVNAAGNWASNFGSKPADSDAAKYELKTDGKSVKANGISVRVINSDGYVAFEEYDAITSVVKKTTKTTFPFVGGKVITAITDTPEAVTFTIDGTDYRLPKASVYPTSITVIRDKDYIIKGGTVEFNIAVNPASNKIYTKEDFELDYEMKYTRAYGVEPDFIKIKDVQPYMGVQPDMDVQTNANGLSNGAIKGQYKMTLEWTASMAGFAKDAAIFIVLNCKDAVGNMTQVISSTPLIMNEKYVSIEAKNVVVRHEDIVMFTDETFTDSIRLSNYHEGYVDKIVYTRTANPTSEPVAIDDLTRYITPDGDKYKFTVVPVTVNNTNVWPIGQRVRRVDVTAAVTDYGRPKVAEIPAKPEIGQPAIPEIPAIPAKTISTDFKVTVYKVPVDNVILNENFNDRWLPNRSVNYTLTKTLSTAFAQNGYAIADWAFEIKSQDLQKSATFGGWSTVSTVVKDKSITTDITKFNTANNFAYSFKLLPTIEPGEYQVVLTVKATFNGTRSAGLSATREFKVKLQVCVVAPKFQIAYKGGHSLIGGGSDTYQRYVLTDVNVADLFDIESTKNISVETDVTPNVQPLSYEFDMTDPRHGAQGVRFNPYPAITAPTVGDWGNLISIEKPVTANVKLLTGQMLPVNVICTNSEIHSESTLYVKYMRLNLHHVDAVTEKFAGNYNLMRARGVDISSTRTNFTPKSSAPATLDPTMIKSIVYSAQGNVQSGGTIPSGLEGKQILQINAATGVVTSIDGITFDNPDAVLYQVFRVTYTDIWSNSAFKEVKVYVKSNSVPVI